MLSNTIWAKKRVFQIKSKTKPSHLFWLVQKLLWLRKIRNSLTVQPGHKSNSDFFWPCVVPRIPFRVFKTSLTFHAAVCSTYYHDASFKIRFMSKSLRTIYLDPDVLWTCNVCLKPCCTVYILDSKNTLDLVHLIPS